MNSKIFSLPDMRARANEIRESGQKLVLTNGCFDLLHAGHVRYLLEAKQLGDFLVVAVNGDESVRALKGEGRPINRADDRAEVLAALESVDYVTIFSEPRVNAVIEALRPAIYVKGGDYMPETLDSGEVAALKQVGAEIRTVALVPGKSTSAMIARMKC